MTATRVAAVTEIPVGSQQTGVRRSRPLLVLLLAACGSADSGLHSGAVAEAVPESERYGGTAVVLAAEDPRTMNPLAAFGTSDQAIQRHVLFMPLLKRSMDREFIPWLAERWDTVRVAPDTLALTFHLRRDVAWHDGVPVTAEDVEFTFERAVDPRTGFWEAHLFDRYSRRVELVDSHTIRFRLQPRSDFLTGWHALPPVPKHILAGTPPERLASHPFGTREPVGNGPFRFARWLPSQEWVFEANPEFPAALGGRPYLDRVVFRVVPDAVAARTELLTRAADIWSLGWELPTAAGLAGEPGIRLLSSTGPVWRSIAWNTRHPLFDTAETRRALTLALDRETIAQAIGPGLAIPGRSTVTPEHWSFDPDAPAALSYDPEAAKRLLAAAGWRDRDGDGVLEDEQGRPFRFTLRTPAGSLASKELAEMVQAQLRRIGVRVDVHLVEVATLIQDAERHVNARGERERRFDAVTYTHNDGPLKDDTPILHSRTRHDPGHWTGYADPRLDRLLDTLASLTDRHTALPLWREYQRLIEEEAPYTVLYYPMSVVAVRTRLQGIEGEYRGMLSNVHRWWILPGERRAGEPGARR
jgi:peptide/nickel transport system substrate-binding protein